MNIRDTIKEAKEMKNFLDTRTRNMTGATETIEANIQSHLLKNQIVIMEALEEIMDNTRKRIPLSPC